MWSSGSNLWSVRNGSKSTLIQLVICVNSPNQFEYLIAFKRHDSIVSLFTGYFHNTANVPIIYLHIIQMAEFPLDMNGWMCEW